MKGCLDGDLLVESCDPPCWERGPEPSLTGEPAIWGCLHAMHMLSLQTDSLSVLPNQGLSCNIRHDVLHASPKSCRACAGPHASQVSAAQH